LGSLLHALAGYDAQPGAAQLGFYLASLLLVSLAARHLKRQASLQQAAAARRPQPVSTSSSAARQTKTTARAATG
jgi:hypothetical protein